MGLKEALGLGFELSSFILVSYWIHGPLAQWMNWDANLTLSGLMAMSLAMWTLHAYFAVERKS